MKYFLEFFLWALLISECANMQGQFEGGKNTDGYNYFRNASTLVYALYFEQIQPE